MNGLKSRIWFIIDGVSMSLILTGILMYLFKVGRNPLLAMALGLIIIHWMRRLTLLFFMLLV
jgi:hypothetical protein